MIRKNRILLAGRPDHSMQIYARLLEQDDLDYKFLTFKVVPRLLKKFTGIKRVQTVSKHCSIHLKATIINILNCRWGYSIDETNCMDRSVRRELKNGNYCLIHYWPKYCYRAVADYKRKHPELITLADVHMPNPSTILNTMQGIYARYGIASDNAFLSDFARVFGDYIRNETDIFVPSSYVVETMKTEFPDKRYHIVPYGITMDSHYRKREKITEAKHSFRFVYAGGISIEKGCDVLLEWFSEHPRHELHLCGNIPTSQRFIFDKYRDIPNIVFHGSVPKSTLQQLLRTFDAGIHLSRFDAYSLAVGEIVGCGLPVIVSDCTGIKDDVCTYGWGIVTALEPDNITKAIDTLMLPENYNKFTKNIDRYIRSNPKSFAEKTIELYKSLLHER